uniref:Uncharacterized protein n=1 Tax=Tetranychus urticae TaxID=32264 RepID=T1KKE7_TETUR
MRKDYGETTRIICGLDIHVITQIKCCKIEISFAPADHT